MRRAGGWVRAADVVAVLQVRPVSVVPVPMGLYWYGAGLAVLSGVLLVVGLW